MTDTDHWLDVLVDDCDAAVAFYTTAFDGREQARECLMDGHILHAEITVGDYLLHVSEASARPDAAAAGELQDVHVLECDDPAAVAARCAAAGAKMVGTTTVRDPAGVQWTLTPVRSVL